MNKQIPILYGDLLRSDEKVIAQGCNTRGIMGAGIAGQIAQMYPLVLHANQREVIAHRFVPGTAQMVVVNPKRTVFNLATQEMLGPEARLPYIYLAFRNLAEQCVYADIHRVGIPQIGCGIGGQNWHDVERAIDLGLSEVRSRGHVLEVVCYIYDPKKAIPA